MNGYSGRVLAVDLSAGIAQTEPIAPEVLKAVVGGAGLGALYLHEEVGADVGPFDDGNVLIFSTGPYQATTLPGSAKWSVCARSPLSNGYGESAAGATWGIALKRSGFDAIVIRGKASEPVVLSIEDGHATLRPASDVWGRTTFATIDAVRSSLGNASASVATIGPAGESLVRYASIMVDGYSAAGRTGMGAVMGSKRLKAIAISGSGPRPQVSDAARLKELHAAWLPKIREGAEILVNRGTPGFMDILDEIGDVPTKNWQLGHWPEGNAKLAWGEYEKIFTRPAPCAYCPVGCHRHVRVESPEAYRMDGPGPEYETLALLGQNCLIADLPAVAKANDLCNAFGLDTISTGSAVAFAMECFEKRYLSEAETDGLRLEWGNAEAMVALVRKIGEREGIGHLLAEGVARASEEISPETQQFAVATKGVEHPGHDPRAFFALGLNYMTGVRGACHERGNLLIPAFGATVPEMGIEAPADPHTMDGVPKLVAAFQDWSSFWNSLVICRFMGVSFADMVDGLNAATGWGWSGEEAAAAAERIFTLQRLVGVRFGNAAESDVLPPRALEPAEEGPRAGKAPENLGAALREYYDLRGWSADGVPTHDTIQRVGLRSLVSDRS